MNPAKPLTKTPAGPPARPPTQTPTQTADGADIRPRHPWQHLYPWLDFDRYAHFVNPELPRPPLPPSIPKSISLQRIRWYPLGLKSDAPASYRDLPENQAHPDRPWHVGYLVLEDRKTRHAIWNLGGRHGGVRSQRAPRPAAYRNWHWYVCRECGAQFTKQTPPALIHRPDCGCMDLRRKVTRAAKIGQQAQTARLEGAQFGKLIVVEYRLAKGAHRGGWDCVCECGRVEQGLTTVELRNLRKLACCECCPEEYGAGAGRKAQYGAHGQLRREHLARIADERTGANS